ncbi:MAG: prepilin-type N-terminal cleavage/methylation domain-containing protein [Alphaproteobacteria bacterium]|nr:prepilin-type N-terminal cleavage/methylation domain-containing protein [Alphaproteobacteria bacterium]
MVFDKKQNGFTLVELSVVLAIIGILMGVFMKSRIMLRDSKLKSVIAETQKIKRGAQSFRLKYGAWPGDYRDAMRNVNNCPTAAGCGNGNGNGVIENSLSSNEASYFWKHLYLNGFIANEKTQSRIFPNSSWEVYYSSGIGSPPNIDQTGHWLMIHADASGNCCFSLQEQNILEKRHDDSNGDTGLIVYSPHNNAIPNEASAAEIRDGGLGFKLEK